MHPEDKFKPQALDTLNHINAFFKGLWLEFNCLQASRCNKDGRGEILYYLDQLMQVLLNGEFAD